MGKIKGSCRAEACLRKLTDRSMQDELMTGSSRQAHVRHENSALGQRGIKATRVASKGQEGHRRGRALGSGS